MLGDIPFPIRPVVLDRETCFFLPSDFVSEYEDPERALREFMLIDIYQFKDGKYLPQSDGFKATLEFAQNYLKRDEGMLQKLFFHNEAHTFHPIKGVVAVALKLAIIDGVCYKDSSYERIGLASALHDIGNIVQRQLHEQISIDDSRQMLIDLGYDREMVSGIACCIRGTEIDYTDGVPLRKVGSREAKIVSDADLSNPGFYDVTNFAFESIKLWFELDKFDISEFTQKGADFTNKFFNNIGDYYTAAARCLFSENRTKNMQSLQKEIERIMYSCNGNTELLQDMILQDDKRIIELANR